MQDMRYETENLKKYIQVGKQEPTCTEYFTDEEELAKKTEWIVKRKGNTKKRKKVCFLHLATTAKFLTTTAAAKACIT